MELNQVRYFLQVAQTRHVTRSAEQLHISQPALTQSIHRLEQDLGVPLLRASGRGIALTEYGRYLCAQAQPLLAAWDALPAQMQTMAALESETIHLNVLAASSLVLDAIVQFKKEEKNVVFQLMQSETDELFDLSVNTQLIYQGRGEENCYVCKEKIFLAAPAEGALAQRSSVSLPTLRDAPFISLSGFRNFRAICDKLCEYAGFAPHIIFESDNPQAVKSMIAVNMGVGFWPEFTWGDVDRELVRLLEIEDLVCQRDLIFTYQRNKPDSRCVERFFDFLVDYTERRRRAAGVEF